MIAALLDAGATADLPDNMGATPLFIAAHMFQTRLAKKASGEDDTTDAAPQQQKQQQQQGGGDGQQQPPKDEEQKGPKRVLKEPVAYRTAMRALIAGGADLGRLAPTLVEIVHALQLANEDLSDVYVCYF